MTDAERDSAPEAPEPEAPEPSPGQRFREALRPRATRTQLIIGVLCALVGFGAIAQVDATRDDSLLRTARTPDLVRLLDDLGERRDRLDAEREELTEARDQLLTGADTGAAALREAQDRAKSLGILAGTVPDTGPGVVVRISDPSNKVTAAVLVDAVQELRDAGAEAIQVGSVRVVASTSFVDGPDGTVIADGTPLTRPIDIRAVGDPDTLGAALGIPGGVVDTVADAGGTATIQTPAEVEIDALRVPPTPRYARPVPTP